MSYNNSDKEFYYALYLKFNKEILEKVLNIKLLDIDLDKNINGRKVDIYGIAEDYKKIFIELQLNQSDNTHLLQIFNIVENKELNNIIIVWGAIGFNIQILNNVKNKIYESGKNVYFVALKINEKVISYLNILNNIFINEVIENLKILNEVENQFKIIEIFYRLQDEDNTICTKNEEGALDLNKKQDVMKYLLQELRKQIYYYPSIYRDKKLDNNVIVLAGGKAEINYYVGINRKNFLFIELRFGELTKDIFKNLLAMEEEINDKLDYLCEFDVENRKIGTYIFFANGKKEKLIKQIARITNKYIRLFSNYTFNNK